MPFWGDQIGVPTPPLLPSSLKVCFLSSIHNISFQSQSSSLPPHQNHPSSISFLHLLSLLASFPSSLMQPYWMPLCPFISFPLAVKRYDWVLSSARNLNISWLQWITEEELPSYGLKDPMGYLALWEHASPMIHSSTYVPLVKRWKVCLLPFSLRMQS